jgi:hypothetical protein
LRQRRVAAIALFVAVAVASDFMAGAALLPRIDTDVRTFHPYYHHGLLPNRSALTNWTRTNSYVLTTNSLGLRDSSVRDVPLISARYRVVVVGDSFTEGVGVAFDKTFVGMVRTALEPDGVEVFNAGVVSYSGMTDYLKIKYLIEVEGFRFDQLVVFYDLSDPYNDYLLEYYEHFTPRREESTAGAAQRKAWSFVSRHSFFAYNGQFLYNFARFGTFDREFMWWTLDRTVFDRWAGRGLDVSQRYMQQLVELCKRHDVTMTIAVYPWAHLVEKRDLHSLMVTVWSRFAARNGISLINYFPDFINDTLAQTVVEENFRPVDKHWTEHGHAIIAKRLLQSIRGGRGLVCSDHVQSQP